MLFWPNMNSVSSSLLEDLVTYNNELTCVQECVAKIQSSQLLTITHTENGSTERDLVKPFQHLFHVAVKKPHSDVEYLRHQKPDFEVNVTEPSRNVNVFDLEAFLRAIVPKQKGLIMQLEELCNIYPQYFGVVKRLHLLATPCSRHCCQGRILAGTKFTTDGNNSMSFPIAHPPFIYESDKIKKLKDDKIMKDFLDQLKNYLMSPIENDSCLLCLTYDLYCSNDCELKNFRLFFLENLPPSAEHASLDLLYESHLEESNAADQCFLFDLLMDDISLLCFGNKYVIRYWDSKKQQAILYF